VPHNTKSSLALSNKERRRWTKANDIENDQKQASKHVNIFTNRCQKDQLEEYPSPTHAAAFSLQDTKKFGNRLIQNQRTKENVQTQES
jgi:hypothetical protein